ncbi:MAG: alpha/beta hydrolase [Candidatus Moranbacteria bacterium]|jgi:pimeloyl-ACP methyl ester carboxylesterase|nr:alpha/beta hydrolase [Candidatus Moranbacteria bacterium]
MKNVKKLSLLGLIFLIIFSPFDFSAISRSSISDAQGVEFEEISSDITWTGEILIEKPVVVKEGVTLTIGKGSTVTFKKWMTLNVYGKLNVDGTAKNPVKIKGEVSPAKYSINTSTGGEIRMRNVDIRDGGDAFGPPILIGQNEKIIYNSATAAEKMYLGAVHIVSGGVLDLENCNFHDNIVAVGMSNNNVDGHSSFDIRVNRSKFQNNSELDVFSAVPKQNFQYNWWGSEDGPEKIVVLDMVLNYVKIKGDIDFSNWAKKEDFHDPVIIIPGILGSWRWTDISKLKLDPIKHSYEGLIEEFEGNGYEKGKDLFEFPYNWRASNVDTAELLKQKIFEVKKEANWPRVDVVAHSMGGLVAREYIESAYYDEDVDQLLTLGTPNQGAPKDYLMWEAGEVGVKIGDFIDEKIISLEAHENGFDNIFDYVQNLPMKSVQELLPVYDYLKDAETGEMKEYHENYPRNEFLENLNKTENIAKLENIEMINIFGKTKDDSTITAIRVEDTPENKSPFWPDGYPENYDSIFPGDHGLETGEGDQTVPITSATFIPADEEIKTNYTHGDLPNKASSFAYEYISGKKSEVLSMPYPEDGRLMILVFSPIDIQVSYTDKDGIKREIGSGIANETGDGAIYFNYHIENGDGENIGEEVEFAIIPNPQDGEYKILTQGTGDGEYEIQAVKIQEDSETGEVSEISSSKKGIAKNGEEKEIEMNLAEGEIVMGNIDTIPPVIQISSPEEKEYLNNQMLDLKYEITDNQTSQENIQKKILLDENQFDENSLDLSLMHLGKHSLKISANDEAQNKSEKEIIFQTETSPAALRDNINHYFGLKMILQKSIADRLVQCTKVLEHYHRVIERIQTQKGVPDVIRKKLLKRMEANGDMYINQIIVYIEGKVRKGKITKEAGSLLVEGFDSLR